MDYSLIQKEGSGNNPAFDVTRLQEEIYQWHPGQEDVWGCIEDPAISRELRNLFVEGFAPNLTPEQRSMEKFREAVEKLKTTLDKQGASSWADTMQMVRVRREELANLRSDIAISLLNHLLWILHTFESVPGASVTIR